MDGNTDDADKTGRIIFQKTRPILIGEAKILRNTNRRWAG